MQFAPSGPLALIAELKRRRVFNVAAVYIVVAWVVIQAAATLIPLLHLPEWGGTLVAVIAILGFPIAIVLSWAYDVTPGGGELATVTGLLDPPAGESVPVSPSRVAPEAPARSVAVLPFVNMSSDPEQEYFSDGITEELLHTLAQYPELRVAARTSSFAFKGQNADIREVGEKLGVGTVLEGSVRKGGNHIRLTAQLINVEDGYHLWSKTYDRELEDIFRVQDEISRSIAEALKLTLVGGYDTPVAKASTANVEAYELYLKGRHHYHRWDEASLRKAIGFFEQALQKDPDYALAHAGMADAELGLMNFVPPEECLAKARAAAQRALELDDTLAEPFVSIGTVKACYDQDWEGAERAFRRAIELNASHATAHAFFVFPLIAQGRLEEARQAGERAYRLDPLALLTNGLLATALYYMRRYEAAAARIEGFLEVDDSDYPEVRGYLGMAYLHAGRREEGLEALREAVERSERSLIALAYLARGHALVGDREEALHLLAEVEERAKHDYVSPSFIAAVHASMGNSATALDCLEEAYEKRDMELLFLWVNPAFDSLRSEPRFTRLVERMRLGTPRLGAGAG